jgi:hypothetical protein
MLFCMEPNLDVFHLFPVYFTSTWIPNNIRLPNMTMAISQNSIFYKGLQAYNNLSMEVKQSRTVNEFKRKLNEHLNLVANSNL